MSKEVYPQYSDAHIGAENLLLNRQAEAVRIGKDPGYTPPSRNKHYRAQYPWDSEKHIVVYAFSGDDDSIAAGVSELETLLTHQEPDGLLPNQLNIKEKRKFDLESLFGMGADHCNYGQPPLGGFAALAMHQAIAGRYPHDYRKGEREANQFLARNYGGVALEGLYWTLKRRNGPGDNLVYNIRPEETGRDEGPDLDSLYEDLSFIRIQQIPRAGEQTPWRVNKANTVITQMNRLIVARKIKQAGESLEASREILSFNDVEFNVLAAVDSYLLAELAQRAGNLDDARKFSRFGRDLETQILTPWQPITEKGRGLWFPDARDGQGMFFGLKSNGQPLDRTATVANLSVLLLPNLSADQLNASLDLMDGFMARYGLASVELTSPECDPGYKEKASKWHGPTWLDQSYLLSEGLRLHLNRPDLDGRPDLKQRCRELLWHLSSTAKEVLDMWAEQGRPIPEFYNPHTGQGQRLETVEYFGWSNMGRIILPHGKPSVFTDALLKQSEPVSATARTAASR